MELLRCPICKGKLQLSERTYRCINNHTFDKAKQGYVNLHLSNKKNSGDDKAMVQSRRDFLEKDYYKNISNVVNEIVGEVEDAGTLNILDIGCGEGYYTKKLKDYLEDRGNILGIDISKEAVLFASRVYKDIDWAVGSSADLPIIDGSLDLVLCMFSRLSMEEYSRVLKEDGTLVVVSTGQDHLLELKEVLYDEVKLDFYRPETDLGELFEVVETRVVNYKVDIDGQKDIMSLFDMTPYKWRTPRSGVERLEKLDKLSVTIDVNIDIFKKKR